MWGCRGYVRHPRTNQPPANADQEGVLCFYGRTTFLIMGVLLGWPVVVLRASSGHPPHRAAADEALLYTNGVPAKPLIVTVLMLAILVVISINTAAAMLTFFDWRTVGASRPPRPMLSTKIDTITSCKLTRRFADALTQMTATDVHGFFAHCGYTI